MWLRVYPAPLCPDETVADVIFRCLACQLGLTAFLVLWTTVWVFVIHSFECPHEIRISTEFREQQHQLVIDLATELRQITPISPKWRDTIVKRIEEARQLSMVAAGNGAKLVPGQFWNISGTFLFTVYVMTALGFGAPVPQTTNGKSLSLVYAVFAVPTHIYLMMNASACAVAHVDNCVYKLEKKINPKSQVSFGDMHINVGIPNCSRNSDLKPNSARARLIRLLNILSTGHCVPLAVIIYYITGAIIFGVARQKKGLDVVVFPVEFTVGGGLAQVEQHVRILYGLYVEGAMALVGCALAALRRGSGNVVGCMARKYRLFANDSGE